MNEIETYIREAARKRGIDPNVAVAVAKSEGGLTDPYRQAEAQLSYGREQSYGPFQLHLPKGLGKEALAAGVDPRKDWKAGVDFALNSAVKGGWGPWFGAKKIGITGMEGIGNNAATMGVTINSLPEGYTPPTSVSAPPMYSPPTDTTTAPATPPPEETPKWEEGLKEILGSLSGGNKSSYVTQAAPIQSILPSLEAGDAARVQAAQALMASLRSRRNTRGLSLTGVS